VGRYLDYRIVLLAVFFALLATVGLSMSLGVGLLVFVGTLVAGTATAALTGRADRVALPPAGVAGELQAGSRQAALLGAIEATVTRLEELSSSDLVPAVQSQAAEATTLAHSALGTARIVARAADQLDVATRQLEDVGRGGSGDGAVARLRRRKDMLITQLSSTADQLLDVYGNLVETNATLATTTLGTGALVGAGDEAALEVVSSSLDDLRVIAAELDAVGRQELPPAGGAPPA
jgi:hypothetical protein